MNLSRTGLFLGLFVISALSFARLNQTDEIDLREWAYQQKGISIRNLLRNISPDGAAKGAVVASPSKNNPDYFKHWVRDAGLTMNLVVSLYENAEGSDKGKYGAMLSDYLTFSRQNQTTPNPAGGLGEPLFYANGNAYLKDWGRPQNDGPAIRAITLIRWAHDLLNQGDYDTVKSRMYDSKLPTDTVIKADLEYVSHHWRESNFDLWEEVKGHHFYTAMVQRKALIEGAKLADRLGDGGAAGWYRQQAKELEGEILEHWKWQDGYFTVTVRRDGGVDYKHSGLDASTILGVLHGDTFDGFMPVYHERVLSTAQIISDKFKGLYHINTHGPGIAIGRYPEDRYDGYSTGGEGNPWVLLTAGFAEFNYRVAKGLRAEREIHITDLNYKFFAPLAPEAADLKPGKKYYQGHETYALLLERIKEQGDDYLKRVRYHTPADGNLFEQMNRNIGYMQGAPDLTWSHAALIVAAWERYGF